MEKILEFLGSLSPGLTGLIGTINWGPGWLFGGLGTIALSIYGLSIGRTRTVISLLSIYVALVFDRLFPYLNQVQSLLGNSIETHWVRLGLFLVAWGLIFTVFNFSFLNRRFSSNEFSLFGIILLSLLQLGLLLSIIFSIIPQPISANLSFRFHDYLSTPQALFFWAIAPIPALLFLKQK